MSEADLCRGVNLPQTTINRLLSGQTNDPRISTLLVVAQFFDISVEQLLGKDLIILDSVWKQTKGLTLPVLEWESIKDWFLETKDKCKINHWIKTEKTLNKDSFATFCPASCSGLFGEGSLLIMNRLQEETVKDGQIVLVESDLGELYLRKILKEGNSIYLKRLFTPFEVMPLPDKMIFRAYIVETRNDKFSY